MLDTSKLPHLQPQTAKKKKETDLPEETLWEQILHAFSGKKGIMLSCGIALMIYISVCFQGERILRNGVYNVLKELGEDGFGISYNAPSSYLAFKSGLNLDDLIITAPEKMGGWVLKAGRISVSVNPFTPRTVIIKANGTHSLTTKTIGDIRLVVNEGEVKLRLASKKEPLSLKAVFQQIQTAAPKSMDGFSVANLSVKAEQIFKEGAPNPVLHFNAISENAHLPAYLTRHLPPVVEYIDLTGDIQGIDGSKPALTSWANNGGTIEVTRGEIIWKPFMTRFTGTFGINSEFDVIGASVAKVYGFFELLDMFENGGYIRPSQVSMAKIVLGEKLKKENGEAQPSISSPFSFQTGKIYAGQVLLYDGEGE